jgi:outer membrane protein OmpA-like peptidoglycan-associated protein
MQDKESRVLKFKRSKSLLSLAAPFLLLGALVGCAVPRELVTANDAVEAARRAGKDKECPNEFGAAEAMKNEAYAICKPCDTARAIAMANEATAKLNALCPAKPVAAVETRPAAAPAPVAPAPSVSLSASPTSIQAGQCSTLAWSSTNSTGVTIDNGVGRVDASGSKQVCPAQTTQYRASATGAGGSRDASATVGVSRVVDRLTLHVNFDTAKATIKKADDADIAKAEAFIKKYPDAKISLVGYTDSVGGDAYNQGLSERRAEAVKAALVKRGVDASRISTSGRGKADPVGDNATAKGRAENRRTEVMMISE